MLVDAAAKTWQVPSAEITTETGVLYHKATGKKAGYGEMASLAATMPVPEEPPLKNIRDIKIIGTSRKNVEGKKIVTGQPLYTGDYFQEACW
jgi:isoquinoline 1-oxidoreductase beta subunit